MPSTPISSLFSERARELKLNAPRLTHDGRAVRVHLPDVYVSLSAETDVSRTEREARELERRLRRDRTGADAGGKAAKGGDTSALSAEGGGMGLDETLDRHAWA